MANEIVARIAMSLKEIKRNSSLTDKLIKQNTNSQRTNRKTTTMAALGNIHNIRFVRFLLLVSIATLTIFIYTTYSSNGPLAPPPPAPQAIRTNADGGMQQMLAAATNKSGGGGDAALTTFTGGGGEGGYSGGVLDFNSNHLDAAHNSDDGNNAALIKLNRKAAVMAGMVLGNSPSASGGGGGGAADVLKLPTTAVKKHQHREPTIDVDAVNDEVGPDEDEMERFGNELLEDGDVQNVDNIMVVGSINNSNQSSAQQNNVGGTAQEQAKSSAQGQQEQQKKANNADKILDTDVMIPTTNLQKFIENADTILKNITNEKPPAPKHVTDNNNNKQQLPIENGDSDNAITNDDDVALPPSVVMTIKHPGSVTQQKQSKPPPSAPQRPQHQPQQKQSKPPPQQQKQPSIKPKTPIHPPPKIPINNNTDHTKGIRTSDYYEAGHLNEEINFAKICPNNGAEIRLLILISSAPTHADARLAIRQTWAHYGTRRDVSIAFVLGRTTNETINKELSIENFIYGDMIRGNFIDSYANLTLKTISTLEWVDEHCRQAKFILKTDDDMFINVPKLLQFIEGHAKQKRVIYGRLAKQWKPIRNKKSKYYVSNEQFNQPIFPPFTTGPAYLLTNDIVHALYERALQQVYLKLEDVFTTGIVAQQLGIKRIHANEFLNRRIAFNPCNIRKLISVHMVKSNEQFDLWKKLLDKTTKCK